MGIDTPEPNKLKDIRAQLSHIEELPVESDEYHVRKTLIDISYGLLDRLEKMVKTFNLEKKPVEKSREKIREKKNG